MSRYNNIIRNSVYLDRLKTLKQLEADRCFCRHDITHFLDVARIMYILSLESSLGLDKDVIYAAALLHDTGRLEQYEKGIPHNIASSDFARTILPQCGYNERETELVCSAVTNHRSTSDHADPLSEILYRADKLSRLCFDCNAEKDCYWDKALKNFEIKY